MVKTTAEADVHTYTHTLTKKNRESLIFFTLRFRFHIVTSSYLDVPRIHFRGQFRADVNSRNNHRCNFDSANELFEVQEWNYKGSSEWEFLDTYVTHVVDKNGNEVTDSPLVGGQIFSSDEGPLAKLVDLDVDHQTTTLYGIKFRIQVDGETVLRGDWEPAIIVRDMWAQMKCDQQDSSAFSAISTSKIFDIECPETTKSLNLCEAWNTNKLAVSISVSRFSVDLFTVGNVVGTIGVSKAREPLNVGGDRKLEPVGEPLRVCPGKEPVPDAVNIAPFSYDANRRKLVLDISTAFPRDKHTVGIDLGTLWLGVFYRNTVTTIGEPLPYLDPDIWNQGGVIEYRVHEELEGMVENAPIVVVKEVSSDSSGEHTYPHRELLPTLQRRNSNMLVLLKESKYFIRTTGWYHGRLEHGNRDHDTSEMTVLVTSFGRPAANVPVGVDNRVQGTTIPLPREGIHAVNEALITNASGLATFTFKADVKIPFPRVYLYPDGTPEPCQVEAARKDMKVSYKSSKDITPSLRGETHTLPIEGQVYHFCYFVGDQAPSSCSSSQLISFLAFSTEAYYRPYTWDEHVGPIFKQVFHLHYIMRAVLDMSSYKEVTRPYNLKLLKKVMSKDIRDAGYMPVTRDLSPTKVKMILEWLDRPCYTKSDCMPSTDCQSLPTDTRMMPETDYERCGLERIPRKSDPQVYFKHIYMDKEHVSFAKRVKSPPRPLFGYGSEEERKGEKSLRKEVQSLCSNAEGLKLQLQLAVQLEFATIPLYLTSLYTIMDHCNVEAYAVMRNIIVQEMLHFAQAANILIAIGGEVKIDSEDVVPHYPTTGLPGGVLPSLTLTLEKFTLKHVHNDFMALEVPAYTTVPKPQESLNTIGEFYYEIQSCMDHLGEGIFESPREEMQVEWPWEVPTDVGVLYKVTDLESAHGAIEQIVEQGEGATSDSPVDESTKQHAHFFRFEEIFCENRLEKAPDGESYSYTGDPIPYNPNGVWNMKDSLSVSDIEEGTVCHTQAMVFHRVYRTFLRVLQDTFSGHPEKMQESLKLMEVLKVHAKRCMWAPLNSQVTQPPQPGEVMCGPIWDYEWNE